MLMVNTVVHACGTLRDGIAHGLGMEHTMKGVIEARSVAHGPAASPAQRAGPQFLKSRRSALQRETPSRGDLLYTQALQLARLQDHEEAARTAFETCCKAEPDNTKAWVSWAQFEKRVKKHQQDRFQTCRQVLQQGLSLNRTSAALIQAWGLMELQKGNILAAVLLLERSVQFEPKNSPVLKWRAVQLAQQAVLSRRRKITKLAAQMMGDDSVESSL